MGNINDYCPHDPHFGTWELRHDNVLTFEWETPSYIFNQDILEYLPVYKLDQMGNCRTITNHGKRFIYPFTKDKSFVMKTLGEITNKYPPDQIVTEMRRCFINWSQEYERMENEIIHHSRQMMRECLL